MPDVKSVGKTYQEHLREVRAKQFGYDLEDITPITEGTVDVKPTEKKATKSKKGKSTSE